MDWIITKMDREEVSLADLPYPYVWVGMELGPHMMFASAEEAYDFLDRAREEVDIDGRGGFFLGAKPRLKLKKRKKQ